MRSSIREHHFHLFVFAFSCVVANLIPNCILFFQKHLNSTAANSIFIIENRNAAVFCAQILCVTASLNVEAKRYFSTEKIYKARHSDVRMKSLM